jgi:copper homeostasis protein CutC
LVEASAGRLCILAGAGVSAENYMQIVNEAGVSEVHGSFKGGVPVRSFD